MNTSMSIADYGTGNGYISTNSITERQFLNKVCFIYIYLKYYFSKDVNFKGMYKFLICQLQRSLYIQRV